MKLYLDRKPGWFYLGIGSWQPFKFFGAGGWIALRPSWLCEKFSYEIRRRLRVAMAAR